MEGILFIASGNGGTLKFLYESIKKFDLPISIDSLVSDRECGALHYAKEKNIHTTLYNFKDHFLAKIMQESYLCLLKNNNILILIIHNLRSFFILH